MAGWPVPVARFKRPSWAWAGLAQVEARISTAASKEHAFHGRSGTMKKASVVNDCMHGEFCRYKYFAIPAPIPQELVFTSTRSWSIGRLIKLWVLFFQHGSKQEHSGIRKTASRNFAREWLRRIRGSSFAKTSGALPHLDNVPTIGGIWTRARDLVNRKFFEGFRCASLCYARFKRLQFR